MKMKKKYLTSTWILLCLSVLLTAGAAACTSGQAQPASPPATAAPAMPPTPTLAVGEGEIAEMTPTAVLATPTPVPSPTATAVPPTADAGVIFDTEALREAVLADLPANAFDHVAVMQLATPIAQRPLWVVYSQGFRNFDLTPVPEHFVAVYANENGQWQEVARQDLNTPMSGEMGVGPDFLYEQGVTQVDFEPSNSWLAVDGGVGAHGGTFQLLRFDGAALHIDVAASSASPGLGYFEDINSDGRNDLMLRLHDYYVFCYACGVRDLHFGVYSWDDAGQMVAERTLQPLAQQTNPAYDANNRAVELANAGLWPQAQTAIADAVQAAAGSAADIVSWNAAIIGLYNQAYQAELTQAPYPLLTNIFYGDFAAALAIVRPHGTAQLLTPNSPLIQGTVAQGNEQWMVDYLLAETNAAIAASPDLAAAYYFRAWGNYLRNPADPAIAADLAQAAALDPNEPLFVQDTPLVNRIQFDPGATSAEVTGELGPMETAVYLLNAQAGQRMTVDLFADDEWARVEVRDAQGELLSGTITPTAWQAELPTHGDVIIRVLADEAAGAYTLRVTIPARIQFDVGATSAAVTGELAAHETADYVLSAAAGQTMDVTIASPGENVLLTVVGADGIPLTNGLMSGAMAWRGQLPVTQDYILRAIATDSDTPFTLTVTIE